MATTPQGFDGMSGRRRPWRCLRRAQGDESGVAAVEFALVSVPFLALLFGIFAQGLNFWYGQLLETAVSDATRLITTGQAQAQNLTQQQFKTQICNRLNSMFDCSGKLQVDVQTYSKFAAANVGNQAGAGTSAFQPVYQPGVGGSLVVVRAYYPMPIFTDFMDSTTSNLPNGARLLVSTQVFRNEPF